MESGLMGAFFITNFWDSKFLRGIPAQGDVSNVKFKNDHTAAHPHVLMLKN
jgi:hypothetical protein